MDELDTPLRSLDDRCFFSHSRFGEPCFASGVIHATCLARRGKHFKNRNWAGAQFEQVGRDDELSPAGGVINDMQNSGVGYEWESKPGAYRGMISKHMR
jgi:hypothetical protein